MNKIVEWVRHKTIWFLTVLVTVFGGIATRLVTCTQQTTALVTQTATHPSNQIAAVEAASFVANLFYEGPDDPFATPGAGGEIGKLTHVALRKGEALFGEAIAKIIRKTDDIIGTSRHWASPQIQEGKRALQKKNGHAMAGKYISAFENIDYTQENAEKLIHAIINDADVIVIRPYLTKVYNAKGQGVSFETKTAKFVGLVERSLEKEL